MRFVIITTVRVRQQARVVDGSNYGLALDKITVKGTIPISKGNNNFKIYTRA